MSLPYSATTNTTAPTKTEYPARISFWESNATVFKGNYRITFLGETNVQCCVDFLEHLHNNWTALVSVVPKVLTTTDRYVIAAVRLDDCVVLAKYNRTGTVFNACKGMNNKVKLTYGDIIGLHNILKSPNNPEVFIDGIPLPSFSYTEERTVDEGTTRQQQKTDNDLLAFHCLDTCVGSGVGDLDDGKGQVASSGSPKKKSKKSPA